MKEKLPFLAFYIGISVVQLYPESGHGSQEKGCPQGSADIVFGQLAASAADYGIPI